VEAASLFFRGRRSGAAVKGGIEMLLYFGGAAGRIRQHVVRQHAASAAAERAEISLDSLLILIGTAVGLGMPTVFVVAMNFAMAAMWAAFWPVAMHRGLSQLHAGE